MENNYLMILKTEKEQAELKVKQQINTIRNIIDNLESKIENKELLYESEGLQGNGNHLDTYLSKLMAYQRSIEQFEKYIESQKK
ncbi:hypothetical protein MOF23_22390 [Bacillus inaquosorum]|uniref:hypothetical protein n=1 Tax=Bacillus inaquosorum TaxID=483913 RepID=UPI0022831210|nr:hypothetical protein [Bacillus inaquosorum]MCY9311684.1 hypothetical protein [Bacillus inaquosorum]